MENTDAKALLFSVPEACSQLGIRQNSLFNLIKSGQLEPVKIGARTLFPADELTSFVEKLKQARPGKKG